MNTHMELEVMTSHITFSNSLSTELNKTVGIQMDTNYAPLLVGLFWYSSEAEFIHKRHKEGNEIVYEVQFYCRIHKRN